MRALLLSLFLATAALGAVIIAPAPASAELPPRVYQEARANAASVVVLRVTQFDRLPAGQTQGTCRLVGVVERIERGSAPVGQQVVLGVPCISPAWEPRPGPFPGYRHDVLSSAQRVRVHMTAGTLALRGLDIIDS